MSFTARQVSASVDKVAALQARKGRKQCLAYFDKFACLLSTYIVGQAEESRASIKISHRASLKPCLRCYCLRPRHLSAPGTSKDWHDICRLGYVLPTYLAVILYHPHMALSLDLAALLMQRERD
jgi:hypothetical protein